MASGKTTITWVILGVVGLMILGALGTGSGSYLYNLANQNATRCQAVNSPDVLQCVGSVGNSSLISPVILLAGTVVPIIFFVAIAMKFI